LSPDLLKGVKDAPSRPATGTSAAATGTRTTGSRLGKDFLKGVASAGTPAKGASPRAAQVSAQAMAGLGGALIRQFKPCYDLGALAGTPATSIATVLRLRYNADGSVAVAPALVEQTGVTAANRSYAKQIADAARRAVMRCSPVRLPEEIYAGGWDDFELRFVPNELN